MPGARDHWPFEAAGPDQWHNRFISPVHEADTRFLNTTSHDPRLSVSMTRSSRTAELPHATQRQNFANVPSDPNRFRRTEALRVDGFRTASLVPSSQYLPGTPETWQFSRGSNPSRRPQSDNRYAMSGQSWINAQNHNPLHLHPEQYSQQHLTNRFPSSKSSLQLLSFG